MAAPSVIAVVGSTGYVGNATITALSKAGASVRAVARNPDGDKAAALAKLEGVTVVKGSMGGDDLAAALEGASVAFINSPGAENRAELVGKSLDAAKAAGVKAVVVTSVSTAGKEEILFGRQFKEIEASTKGLGLPYTLVRLPMFTDNIWGQQASVKGQRKMYAPVEADKPFNNLTVDDIGAFFAAVLTKPEAHANETYHPVAPLTTYTAIAKAFTEAVGEEVTHVQVPDEAALKAFVGMGFPEWQAAGVIELLNGINAGLDVSVETNDTFEKVVGRKPTTHEAYIAAVGGAFK